MQTRISSPRRWGVLLAATALLAAGCADATSDDDTQGDEAGSVDYTTRLMNVTEPSGDPVTGGTLRVAEYSEARVLNPTQTYPTGPTGGIIMGAIYDTLMRYDHETDTFVPQLAESLETEDSITWTLTLREGVTFHDGTPLDAEAVIGSFEYYLSAYGLHSLLTQMQIASMTAVDPLTVEIVMHSAWSRFAYVLIGGVGMVMAPAAYADPADFKPIGAGPFKFKSYAPAEKTVVEANEDYWNGRPYLDEIEFVLLGSDRTSYETLQSGGVDVAFVRDNAVVDKAIEDGAIGMVNYAGLATNLWINTREGRPGADKRVRQAIALAFDPEIYLQRAADGAGDPSKLMIGPDSKWAPGVDPMPTDPEAARALLAEAKADGFDGKISIIARSEQASQAGAVAMQGMFEAVGFEVTLDLLTSIADQVQRVYIDFDFDIATGATSINEEDIFTRLASALDSRSPSNFAGYASEEMDALLRELQAIEDPEDGGEVLTKIEALWAEDAPGVAINAGALINLWNEDVHGIKPSGETLILLDKAWIQR